MYIDGQRGRPTHEPSLGAQPCEKDRTCDGAQRGGQHEGAQLAEIKARFVKGSLQGEFVYRTLREVIICGVLPEGRKVEDRVLALELGVSRTPVREALQRLEAEGFLENSSRLGLIVAEVTPQTIEDVFAVRIA